MRFLVDNQLPAALARSLSARNVDCQHVLDLGLAQSSDVEICRYAEAGEIGRAWPRIVPSLEAGERVIELR